MNDGELEFKKLLIEKNVEFIDLTAEKGIADFAIINKDKVYLIEIKNHKPHYVSSKGMTKRNVVARFEDAPPNCVKVLCGEYRPSKSSVKLLKKKGIIDLSNMTYRQALRLLGLYMVNVFLKPIKSFQNVCRVAASRIVLPIKRTFDDLVRKVGIGSMFSMRSSSDSFVRVTF